MKKKILILGSTGKLGTKLLEYCLKNNLQISAVTCYTNVKKIQKQKNKSKITNSFCLSKKKDELFFLNYLKNNNFSIVYFLDYGSYSLKFVNIILKKNKNCILAIANKEILIAGFDLTAIKTNSIAINLYNSKH